MSRRTGCPSRSVDGRANVVEKGENLTSDEVNPYAAPGADQPATQNELEDPATLAKIEAIIKDASQFWLAILLCIFCSALGAVLIGPWYLVRLLQWNAIAQSYPQLLDPYAPPGSLPQRFQSARKRLFVGIGFGVVAVLFGTMIILALLLTTAASAP